MTTPSLSPSSSSGGGVVTSAVAVDDRSFTRVKYQVLVAIIVNFAPLGGGCGIGWYSPALPLLQSEQTPLLDGPISGDMSGWIGASLAIGGIFGCLGFGLLGNWTGFKRSILLTAVPMIIAWLLIIFGQYAWQLIVARFLNGLVMGGSYTCISMFIAEFASDFIRGQLNSYIQIAVYGGILIGFIGGSYIPFHINPYCMITVPIMFVVLFAFVPESPQYLLARKRRTDAEQSLRFYRNCRTPDTPYEPQLLAELQKLDAIAAQNAARPAPRLADFVTPTALRAMSIGPFLMAVNQFSGAFAIANYAETIFKRTGSTLDPQVSAIVMAVTQVIGCYAASQLMDRMGRKALLVISSIGAILALLVTGTFTYVAEQGVDVSAFNWVPLVFISFFIFIGSIGLLPVPYVILAEVIPANIRRVASSMCTCVVFICAAIMLRLMPLLLDELHMYGSMWLFAAVCLVGLVFTLAVVEETNGLNLDVLETDARRDDEKGEKMEVRLSALNETKVH